MTSFDVEDIKAQAASILEQLVGPTPGDEVAEQLRPDSSDYPEVFVAGVVETARAGYEALWAEAPSPEPKTGQTELEIWAAPASFLGEDNEVSRRFPNGYRRIAHLLVPERIWLAWKFVRPGETTGMAYDGLVWRGDRFAWFPKPWRIIG